MYLLRTEFTARAVGAGAVEANTARLGEMRKGQPGYLGQTLLRSYSYPDKYIGTSRWETVEAAWAFSKSGVLADYRKSQVNFDRVQMAGGGVAFATSAASVITTSPISTTGTGSPTPTP